MRRTRNRQPEAQAIDPKSGFKVPLSNLVREYTGDLVDYRFADKQNPQDFVRGRADNMRLPYYRPEAPDRFMAVGILWEDFRPMTCENGNIMLTEGELVVL